MLEQKEEAIFDAMDEILRQLRAGEDSRAEFKRVDIRGRRILGPDREKVAAGFVAFASAGRHLLLRR